MSAPVILWLRQDLRLHDNAALVAACSEGPVIPVYVLDDEGAGDRRIGGAQRWWLHHSLASLSRDLAANGSKLILRRGNCAAQLTALASEAGAARIHANHHYEPWWQRSESEVAADLPLVLHHSNHLAPPRTLLTGSGGRYRVFTPWWRALLTIMPPPKPLPAPDSLGEAVAVRSDALEDWGLLPTKPDWSQGFSGWAPGEKGARDALRAFLPRLPAYNDRRNFPSDETGISRLSPHTHMGEISPATIWHIATREAGASAEPFLRELGWRDYGTNLLDQFPRLHRDNGKPAFASFAWRTGEEAEADYRAWTKGQTGYPIVDAGMRELWSTGFMHNRVRMITASFLVKHLLIDWQRGERWFWDTLLDADAGANAANWQWVAGTGVDAPLFSRIMAPLSQSEKFDAGDYIRRWVPELSGLADPYVHDPDEFGVRPRAYPAKLIGHRAARERTLAAWQDARDVTPLA